MDAWPEVWHPSPVPSAWHDISRACPERLSFAWSAPARCGRRASAGIIFAVLFTASLLLFLGRPPAGATSAELATWTSEASQRWFIGLQLVPFAGIAFLWFLATIRNRIGRSEDQFLATVFIGSGLLFVAMMFAGGAAAAAPVTIEEPVRE